MSPRRSTIPFLVLLAPVVFVGGAPAPAVSAFGAPRPTSDGGSRGKETGAVRSEAVRLVTGSPVQLQSVVAGTPPTAVMKIVPVAAKVGSYPGGTTIVGDELTAFTGGFRAWFEFKLSDWDPNGDNDPALKFWQFMVDDAGFEGANADPSNPGVDLILPAIACANNAPCVTAFGEAWAKCDSFHGICMTGYVNRAGTGRPDSWCADTGFGPCDVADCDTTLSSFRCFSIYSSETGRPDEGIEYYGATVVLDIPPGAQGKYTVNLFAAETFLADAGGPGIPPNDIPTLAETGFVVNIIPPTVQACCLSVGGCLDIDSAECANGNDTPQGQGTTCLNIQCPEPTGSCCNTSTFSCTDYVLAADCSAPLEWTAGSLCVNLPDPCLPTGACCDRSPGGGGICSDGLLQAQCAEPQRVWTQEEACADIECEEVRGPCCNSTTFACTNNVLQSDCQGAEIYWRTGATCESCTPGPQMFMEPVPAKVGSYPPGTTIVGNELTAPSGGFRAWFEFKLSHWDQNGDNVPPLNVWQFRIDTSGYEGANADPSNPGVELTPPVIACANNAPCVTAFGEAWAQCEKGTCNPAYVDNVGTGRADSWCADTGSGACSQGDCRIQSDLCYSVYPTGVGRLDAGIEYYGATVVLDIPAEAKGRYMVNLDTDNTYLFDAKTFPEPNDIPTLSETGFVVNIPIGSCCDGNTGVCTDAVVQGECVGDQRIWNEDMLCDDLDPLCTEHTGACCDSDAFGGCTDDTISSQCVCPTCEWSKGSDCTELECNVTPIPTVGEWGLVVLTLLLLTVAKVAFRAGTRSRAHAS